jgi:hypothetical protein
MSVLDIHSSIVVYGDGEIATSNPQRVYVDWSTHVTGVSVVQPSSREYQALPGETLSIFSGVRTTAIDNTTTFALTLNSVKSGVYRLTYSSGTAPAFRTARTVNTSGVLLTISINNNATAEVLAGGAIFGNVQVGDIVFIPNTTTGDAAGPFNVNNVGFWVVLATSTTKITLKRRVGEAFSGVAEAVTPSSNSQFTVFSAAGVQVGDTVEISAGFSAVTQKAYVVSEVTATWVEFTSTENLPLESGIVPTATGVVFYNDSKRFVRVEVDQDAAVRLNGDTGNSVRLAPRVSGDPDQTAHFEKWGPCWQLVIVNRSTTSTMVINVISAE